MGRKFCELRFTHGAAGEDGDEGPEEEVHGKLRDRKAARRPLQHKVPHIRKGTAPPGTEGAPAEGDPDESGKRGVEGCGGTEAQARGGQGNEPGAAPDEGELACLATSAAMIRKSCKRSAAVWQA